MALKVKAKSKRAMTSDLPPRSEAELTRHLNDDLKDAWLKLRAFLVSLGAQRSYTSSAAIMFARERCFAFVRPQKSYVQLTFFLDHLVDSPDVKRGNRVTDARAANVFKLVHADQVEEPLTDWLREAYAFADPTALTPALRRAAGSATRRRAPAAPRSR